MAIATVSPTSGETLRTFEPLDESGIEAALQRATSAFRVNRARSFPERALRLRKAADLLEHRSDELGRVVTTEMGKPLKASVAEIQKCALVCRYYAEHGQSFLSDEPVKTEARRSYVHYEPLGPLLAVMPWNFPFWQVFRFAAPGLMAGNTGLLKHSSNVPQCALAIEQIFHDAGFIDGEFQTLLITSEQVQRVVADERVKATTLTGSEPAGAAVASNAAKHIKKSVLELGGSDPFIVMSSADLGKAVEIAVKARIVNNGQSCIAAKRFIVQETIADSFEAAFTKAMASLNVGDPFDPATDVGPLAMPQLVDDLDAQVKRSVAAGARLLTGGHRIGERGNFYAPTVLAVIPPNAPVAREETFGPVASIFRVKNVEEAIVLANDTDFGLAASVWTNDEAEMAAFIDGIEAGQVFVNAMVASDPRMPFGGVKHSGFGRELGVFGIREFVNVKTVWIAELGSTGSNTE
jgi:succinate-semialdehyde dehydrogenase/glutarate-semialdehyde dehydrogenase